MGPVNNNQEQPADTQQPPLRNKRPALACERCRAKHRKCDIADGRRICTNCEKASVPCKGHGQTELRIRFVEAGPNKTKRRKSASVRATSVLRSPGRLRELDQTPIGIVSHGFGERHMENGGLPSSIDTNEPRDTSNSAFTASSAPLDDDGSAAADLRADHHTLQVPPVNNTPIDDHLDTLSEVALPMDHESISTPRVESSGIWSNPSSESTVHEHAIVNIKSSCLWPLAEKEARLVKHFFTVLVSWFDYCIPGMHFRSFVGSTISNDPSILFAVLAISARHREVTMGADNCNSHEYERKCLKNLIPSLSNTAKDLDDTVLASAVLIRLLEEMTEPPEDQNLNSHAVSAPILLQIKRGNVRSSEFADAAMIVALRQEIFVGNMTKRAVEPISAYCNIDRSMNPATDAMWTYRIIAHAARVTNFAYGSGPKDILEWDQLWQYVHDWEHHKPSSFLPIHYSYKRDLWTFTTVGYQDSNTGSRMEEENQGDAFPVIYYTYDCPIGGQQYLQLCRILLLAYNPRMPTLGIGRAQYLEQQEEEIRGAARIICGISQSNPEYMPARLTAGLAIALCGELFTDPTETTALLRLVSEAELHLGWPGLKVSHQLRTFWNLHDYVL